MPHTFTTTGDTTHSTTVIGLQDGTSYTYYIRCRDGSGNTNTTDYEIGFSVETDNNYARGDLNRDGRVGPSDFGELVANWFQNQSPGILDLDDNGRVGIGDLGVLMSNFGLSGGTP